MSNVFVIADCSGRMAEQGKNQIMEYVLRCAANMLSGDRFVDADPEFFSWGSTIDKIGEPYFTECSGKSDVGLLEKMLGEMAERSPVLFLSDGNFDYAGIKKKAAEKKLGVIGVVIGADASVSAMNAVSTSRKAYKAEDITAAVTLLCSYIGREDEQLCV